MTSSKFNIKLPREEVPTYNLESSEVIGLMLRGGAIVLGEDMSATSKLVEDVEHKLLKMPDLGHIIGISGNVHNTVAGIKQAEAELVQECKDKPDTPIIVKDADSFFDRSPDMDVQDARLDMVAALSRIANGGEHGFCLVLDANHESEDGVIADDRKRRNDMLGGFASATVYHFKHQGDDDKNASSGNTPRGTTAFDKSPEDVAHYIRSRRLQFASA